MDRFVSPPTTNECWNREKRCESRQRIANGPSESRQRRRGVHPICNRSILTSNFNAIVSNIFTALWHEHHSLSPTGNILETGTAADPTLMVTGSDVFQLPSVNYCTIFYDFSFWKYRRNTYLYPGSKYKCHRSPTKRKLDYSNNWNIMKSLLLIKKKKNRKIITNVTLITLISILNVSPIISKFVNIHR